MHQRVRVFLRRAAFVAAFVASTIWDEALLSTPVVASSRFVGALPTFLFFTALYLAGGFGLSLLAVRLSARRRAGQESRFARWVAGEAEVTRLGWARRLLLRSGWGGFALASFALGPIVTTWLLVAVGRLRSDVGRVAFASSAIFSVTFVGPYCGLGTLLP